MNPIGEQIRNARKKAGLTQAQLGQKCNLADSAIRRYESGRGNPTMSTLAKIATALNIGVADLLTTEGTQAEMAIIRTFDKIRALDQNSKRMCCGS